MEARTNVLLAALLVLAGAVVAILVAEEVTSHHRDDRARQFHHATGGLGFGPAIDLSGCAFGFDPRLDGSCSDDYGPTPGAACFSRRRAGSLFPYPPLPPRSRTSGGD
jgi:hypothetical protein